MEILDLNKTEKSEQHIEEVNDKVERVRDENGKIINYHITSYRKNKAPFVATLDRQQMELLMAGYSRYGYNLPKAAISPDFELLTTTDLERIIHACAIYKYDLPFASHQIEELTDDELLERYRKIIETKVVKKLEKQQAEVELKETKKALKEAYKQLADKTNFEEIFKNLNINVADPVNYKYGEFVRQGRSIMLHLSDMHVGAKVQSDCIYDNPYDKEEIHRRLKGIVERLAKMGPFDEIILNELGDSIDGFDQQTARRDHIMPQSMDNKEQVETYLDEMLWFIVALKSLTKNLKIYCVPEGNHAGSPEWVTHLALQQIVLRTNPDIEFYLSRDFISSYEYKDRIFICTHGKDAKFMKRPMPKYLDDKTQNTINNWLRKNNISGDKIHVIKGDLHSDTFDSCEAFTYRNVLSLFGASDYSAYNYIPNNYGISYELFIEDNMLSGTFVNL